MVGTVIPTASGRPLSTTGATSLDSRFDDKAVRCRDPERSWEQARTCCQACAAVSRGDPSSCSSGSHGWQGHPSVSGRASFDLSHADSPELWCGHAAVTAGQCHPGAKAVLALRRDRITSCTDAGDRETRCKSWPTGPGSTNHPRQRPAPQGRPGSCLGAHQRRYTGDPWPWFVSHGITLTGVGDSCDRGRVEDKP